MKNKNIFEKISTKPNYYSTVWKGKRSILATVFLWLIWFCRIFSLLQILKLVYRKIVTLLKRATKDAGSKRVNVPPVFVELYYIFWLVFMILVNIFSWYDFLAIKIISIYFMFESAIWVLYYAIFRRFYEESYSLYHILEYFVILFILVPTQAIALSGLFSHPIFESLAGIMGAGNDTTPVVIRCIGALNTAIVVALVINSFPTEASKTSSKIQENYIIGCGNVVKERLLPALKKENSDSYTINIFDIKNGKGSEDCAEYLTVIEESEQIIPSIDKRLNNRSVIWIETPVSSHVSLLKQALSTDASLIVMEKPITNNAEELKYLRTITQNDEIRNRVFFLSYYLLEKALPLYYLADYNASYKKFLTVTDNEIALEFRNIIGNLKRVEVVIFEGEDDRGWTFKDLSGQLFETFIHNVIIASLFSGLPKYWKDTSIDYKNEGEDKPKIISMTAKSGDAEIYLKQGKFIPLEEQKRYAKFEFENGKIYCDLEKQTAQIEVFSLGRTSEISVKDTYRQKYSIQTSLVNSVFKGSLEVSDVDGLRNQIEIIEFFLDYFGKNPEQ